MKRHAPFQVQAPLTQKTLCTDRLLQPKDSQDAVEYGRTFPGPPLLFLNVMSAPTRAPLGHLT